MLAVAFLMLFSIVIAAVLTQAGTDLKTTAVVKSHGRKLYAADGGIDYGIQKVRDTAELCPDVPSGTMDVGDLTLDDRTVHVTCQTLSGDNGSGVNSGHFGLTGWTTVATGWGAPVWNGNKARCSSVTTPTDLGSTIQIVSCGGTSNPSRTVNDAAITNKKATLTSATAAFTAADKGSNLVGTGIPAGVTIKAVTNATTVTMSKNATATLTGDTVTIGGLQTVTFGGTRVFNAGGFNIPSALRGVVQGSITQYDNQGYCTRDKAAAHYPTPNDKSPVVGAGWTCTQPATMAVPDPAPHVVVPPDPVSRTINDGVLSPGPAPGKPNPAKNVLTSASAKFTTADVGATIVGTGIPAGTTIKTVTNATTVTMSANSTVTVLTNNVAVTITPVTTPAAKTGTCGGNTINYLYPGRYSTIPPWGGYTYMASGVYYIVDTGETAISGTAIVGGEPGPNDPVFNNPLPGCESAFTDAAANTACGGCMPPDPGKGVTFILGGTTLLDIHSGVTELFTRVPGTMDAGATPGTTVFAMASNAGLGQVSGGSYKLSLTAGADRCNCAFVTDNSGQQIIFHGLTYSPYEPVDVFNNAGVNFSPFYGGLVASWIVARVDAGSQSGLFTGQIGGYLGPTKRTIVITATAPGTAPGEGAIVSTAVITVDVDDAKTTEVQSWRNQ
jgi:hypothetical protein